MYSTLVGDRKYLTKLYVGRKQASSSPARQTRNSTLHSVPMAQFQWRQARPWIRDTHLTRAQSCKTFKGTARDKKKTGSRAVGCNLAPSTPGQ